jgi:hypothetical protein
VLSQKKKSTLGLIIFAEFCTFRTVTCLWRAKINIVCNMSPVKTQCQDTPFYINSYCITSCTSLASFSVPVTYSLHMSSASKWEIFLKTRQELQATQALWSVWHMTNASPPLHQSSQAAIHTIHFDVAVAQKLYRYIRQSINATNSGTDFRRRLKIFLYVIRVVGNGETWLFLLGLLKYAALLTIPKTFLLCNCVFLLVTPSLRQCWDHETQLSVLTEQCRKTEGYRRNKGRTTSR